MASKPKTAPAPATALVVPTKDTPVLLELVASANAHKGVAAAYVIDSRDMYEIASATLTDIRDAEKLCESEREKIAKPLHQAWTATNKLFKPISDALAAAKKELGGKMIAFEDQERARVRAAELRAQLEHEAEAKAAQEKLAEATELLAAGEIEPEEFQKVAEDAMVAELGGAAIGHVAAPPERGSHGRRTRWVGDVTSLPDLLEYVARRLRMNDPTFDNTIELKMGQINAFGQSTDGAGKIPGVTFREETIIAARGS